MLGENVKKLYCAIESYYFSLNLLGVLLTTMSIKLLGKSISSAKILIYMPCNQFTIHVPLLCDRKDPCKHQGNVAKQDVASK